MRRQGFTLVEVMIASAVGAILSIAIMTLLSRYTRMASQTGEQATVSREVNTVLAQFRAAIRRSVSPPETGELSSFTVESGVSGQPYRFRLNGSMDEPGTIEIEYPGSNGEIARLRVGNSLFYKMRIRQLGDIHAGLYQMQLWYVNPRKVQNVDDNPKALQNALTTMGIASQRAIRPDDGETFWVPNSVTGD